MAQDRARGRRDARSYIVCCQDIRFLKCRTGKGRSGGNYVVGEKDVYLGRVSDWKGSGQR